MFNQHVYKPYTKLKQGTQSVARYQCHTQVKLSNLLGFNAKLSNKKMLHLGKINTLSNGAVIV